MAAAAKPDYATAQVHIERAAKRVPGSKLYANRLHYIRGIRFIQKQDYAAAVRELQQVVHVYGGDTYFDYTYGVARLNHAWFSDDYPTYLARAEELYALDPKLPESVMCIAAGKAYRYAETGDEQARRESERYLAQLETMDTEKAYGERIARIRRCLETRVIPPH
jgi:hypothetical protein